MAFRKALPQRVSDMREDAPRSNRPMRSALFVPADRQAMVEKAHGRGADVLVFDLEDGVHIARKEDARHRIASYLSAAVADESTIFVRINGLDCGGAEDVEALSEGHVDGFLIPKVEDAGALEDVRRLMERMGTVGRNGRVRLFATVESVRGLLNVQEIASFPGLAGVALGGEDLAADLGVWQTSDGATLDFPRAWLALWARKEGIAALDTVFVDLRDGEGLVREARRAVQLGYTGKLLIHPSQIDPIHRAFRPDPDQLDRARRVLESAAEARTDGRGVIAVDGRMVDAPVIRQATEMLQRANWPVGNSADPIDAG